MGCRRCDAVALDCSKEKILLPEGKTFLISFWVNVCYAKAETKLITLCLQNTYDQVPQYRFLSHTQVVCADAPATISVGNLLVSTLCNTAPSYLSLSLLTPCTVWIEGACITIMEI